MLTALIFSACKEEKNNPAEAINLLSKEAGAAYLTEKYKEIQTIAASVPCSKGSDWDTFPIGAKACGGPAGYIPFLPGKHGPDFFKKIEDYTKAQKAFNTKWGLFSDCAIENKPTRVDCVDGKPVMIR